MCKWCVCSSVLLPDDDNVFLQPQEVAGNSPPFYPLAVSEDPEVQYRLLHGALPTGWDKQHDGSRKRDFYVNHARKMTTWIFPLYEAEDHRAAAYMSQVCKSVGR